MKKKILFLAFGCFSIMAFADIHVTWTTTCGTAGHHDFPEGTSTTTIENYISNNNFLMCGVRPKVKVILAN